MLINSKDLININDSKIYDISVDSINFENNLFVKEINNINGFLEFYYDDYDSLHMNYSLDCSIVCPGSISPDDVLYSDHFEDDEVVCFNENDEGFFIRNQTSDIDIIKSIILPLIPIKAENGSDNMHKEGDGWIITSEKEYAKMSKEKVDSRLEILKNYKEVK